MLDAERVTESHCNASSADGNAFSPGAEAEHVELVLTHLLLSLPTPIPPPLPVCSPSKMRCIRNPHSSSPFTAAALVCGRLPPKGCFNNVNEIISLLGSKPSVELHSIESKAETLQWRSPLGPPTPPWTHLPVLLRVVRPGGLYLEHLPQTPAWFTLSPSPNCYPNNCPAVRPTLYHSNHSPHQHLFQTP